MTNLIHLDNFRTRPISRVTQDQLVLTPFIILVLLFLSSSLSAQKVTFPKIGAYYRLENIDSLRANDLDSIRGELQYYEITIDTIENMNFPITIYKSFDNWTGDHLFKFVFGDNYSLSYTESSGKINNRDVIYYSELIYCKRDENYKPILLDSSVKLTMTIRNDSLLINNKFFKEDITRRIFQRFTGY